MKKSSVIRFVFVFLVIILYCNITSASEGDVGGGFGIDIVVGDPDWVDDTPDDNQDDNNKKTKKKKNNDRDESDLSIIYDDEDNLDIGQENQNLEQINSKMQ